MIYPMDDPRLEACRAELERAAAICGQSLRKRAEAFRHVLNSIRQGLRAAFQSMRNILKLLSSKRIINKAPSCVIKIIAADTLCPSPSGIEHWRPP